jgi:hypothetical protein
MSGELFRLVEERLLVGWERYGHGLLHASNTKMNFKKELIEELLDAVIYAGADVIKHAPQVSSTMAVADDGRVQLRLGVNYELERDGNVTIVDRMRTEYTKKYDFLPADTRVKTLLLCMFALDAVLKIT